MPQKSTVTDFPNRFPEQGTTDTSSGTMVGNSALTNLLEMAFTRKEPSGGGGGGNGNIEARIAKLESSVEYIQRDISEIKDNLKFIRNVKIKDIDSKIDSRFWWTVTIVIALYGILIAMIGKGFKWF